MRSISRVLKTVLSNTSTSHAPAQVALPGLALVLIAGSAVVACGDGATEPPPPAVASVEVSPATATLTSPDGTLQLSVIPRDTNGNTLVGRTVTWSSNSGSATVSSSGLVTGMGAGTATITATSEGNSGTAVITVISGSTTDLGTGFGAEQFAQIPAGTFQMGDIIWHGFSNERPVHTVNITEPYYMQKTEVTQGQWRAVMGNDPSHHDSCGDTCPVEQVSWNEIQTFIATLNAQDPGKNYRLPTEAEWEYAARAGTSGDYGGTGVLDDMGWYGDNSGSTTHPAAEKQNNAWALYDMHGNVWEFVQDWYSPSYYSVSPTDDPMGPATGTYRVLRGGSLLDGAPAARSSRRLWGGGPTDRHYGYGFRLARTP